MSVTANGSTVYAVQSLDYGGTGAPEGIAPWVAAHALGDLPVRVLAHAVRSGQIPEAAWFMARLADGSRVLRYDVEALRAWAATKPKIDPSLPPLPSYAAGHTASVPAPRGAS